MVGVCASVKKEREGGGGEGGRIIYIPVCNTSAPDKTGKRE